MSTEPPVTFFEPEELASFAERARLDVHGGVKGEPTEKGVKLSTSEEIRIDRRNLARLLRGLAGLRLAARCYALARDPAGLTPIVWGTWGVGAWRDRFETHVDTAERIATAVESVGARVLEVPGLAEQLASSPLREVRRALAEALPAGPASEPLLRALAQDDDAEVRKAARAKIGDDDRWDGAFPIPPGDHPDEVLEAARRVLELPIRERKHEDTVGAFAPLSDALAIACWERVLAPFSVGSELLRGGLACLLERPGGGAGLARLISAWERGGNGLFAAKLVTAAREGISEGARERAFAELAGALRDLEREERASEGGPAQPYLRMHVANAAAALAPARGDARALLEIILGAPIERASEEQPPEKYDYVASQLSSVLAGWPLDDALRTQLVEMRRAGEPGRWARVGREVWEGLGPDPVLRERARRDLEDDKESVRGAAISALLGPLHDPAEDGEVEAVARELYARPALRPSLLGRAESIRPQARRDLEAGALDLRTAMYLFHYTPRDERTDAMWAAARTLRDRAMADPDDDAWLHPHVIQHLIELGEEWDPSDLAYARAVLERALTVPDEHGCLCFLIGVLDRKPSEESTAMLREIDERATTDAQRESAELGRRMSASARAIGL